MNAGDYSLKYWTALSNNLPLKTIRSNAGETFECKKVFSISIMSFQDIPVRHSSDLNRYGTTLNSTTEALKQPAWGHISPEKPFSTPAENSENINITPSSSRLHLLNIWAPCPDWFHQERHSTVWLGTKYRNKYAQHFQTSLEARRGNVTHCRPL